MIQTNDGGYLAMGSHFGLIRGWLAKIDKHGHLKWEHTYFKDTTRPAYLSEAEERANGGFAVAGQAFSCTNCTQDTWLLSIDSNGCEVAGCSYTTAVPAMPISKSEFLLYPNPTTGIFTVSASLSGTLTITNIQGSKVCEYEIAAGTKKLSLSITLAPGIYIGQYKSADGKENHTLRISYQP